ncbi:tail fiber protein [Empedobacter brevis]|uniref:tail fiber protein n=1 Tax=Empedobacter brevis TaxID=247 RepID=UPI0023F339A8|nr:tail fiber protein [Empedobacter brevis]
MKKILLSALMALSSLSFGQTLGEFISLELKSTSNIVTYVDFKGKNNQTADFVGRLDYTDGTGFSFSKWGNQYKLLELKDNGELNLFGNFTFIPNTNDKILKLTGGFFEPQQGIQFITSGYGSGYGIRLESKDQSNGNTGLNFTVKNGNSSTWNSALFIKASSTNNNGFIGIGTENPDEKLTVKGKIHAEEIIVDLAVPADYVFQKYFTGKSELKADYEFPKLEEVEKFVKENNHLPGIPSAKEIQEKGLKVGEMNNLLLQKIEELTLLLIEQNKKMAQQEERINELETKK